MAVGSGKTALGVASILAFTGSRALVVTPGVVIRGTFDKALNPRAVGNCLVGLPGGPLVRGREAPHVLTLDRRDGPIHAVPRERLTDADVIVTNFQALVSGPEGEDLISRLQPGDIDFIVVDDHATTG
jgi:hypothetical protein